MKLLIIILSALMAATFAAAQTPTEPHAQDTAVFDSMRNSVSELITKTSKKDAKAAELLKKINANVEFLSNLATSPQKQKIPAEYMESLTLNARLLKELAEKNYKGNSRKSLYKSLDDVNSDLEIKVANMKGGRGDVARLVQLTVHARKEDQERACWLRHCDLLKLY